MESFLRQSILSILRGFFGGVVCITCQYVYLVYCFISFTLTTSVNMKCAGRILSTVSSVFKYIAVGFMEVLKPFVGLFHNGSIARSGPGI